MAADQGVQERGDVASISADHGQSKPAEKRYSCAAVIPLKTVQSLTRHPEVQIKVKKACAQIKDIIKKGKWKPEDETACFANGAEKRPEMVYWAKGSEEVIQGTVNELNRAYKDAWFGTCELDPDPESESAKRLASEKRDMVNGPAEGDVVYRRTSNVPGAETRSSEPPGVSPHTIQARKPDDEAYK